MWAVRSPRIGGGRRRRRPSRAKEIAGTGERVRITQGTTERIALLAVDRYLLTGGRDADERVVPMPRCRRRIAVLLRSC